MHQLDEKLVMAETGEKGTKRTVRATKRKPGAVDAYVGSRIQKKRTSLGISQKALAEAVGITFQQVYKYESGYNEVGAGRLFLFGQALNVPVAFFYDDMPTALMPAITGALSVSENSEPLEANVMTSRETAILVRAYYRIEDRAKRRMVWELLRSMSS